MNTWRVGRAYAALKLRELDGVFGGELAGHYYFRDFFYSDSGLLAAILILNVVAKMKARGISLSQLIGRIEKYQNSGEINFKLDRKKEAMDAVRDYFMAQEKATAYMSFQHRTLSALPLRGHLKAAPRREGRQGPRDHSLFWWEMMTYL